MCVCVGSQVELTRVYSVHLYKLMYSTNTSLVCHGLPYALSLWRVVTKYIGVRFWGVEGGEVGGEGGMADDGFVGGGKGGGGSG